MRDSERDARSCDRKKRYPSEHAAKRAVRLMQKWSQGHCEQLNVYLCAACKGYHAGRNYDKRR